MQPLPDFPPLSQAAFADLRQATGTPFVMRGQAAHWPAVRAGLCGAGAACAYLAHYANDGEAEFWIGDPGIDGRFAYNADLTDCNFARAKASVPTILQLLMTAMASEEAPSIFAGAINIATCLPGLEPEVAMPLLRPAQPRRASLWMGTPGKTSAHWDYAENLACPILGRRTFLLFPIDQLPNMYMGPLDRTPAGQPISLVHCEAPDLERHPRFAEALNHGFIAELNPGDVLYIPSMWLHHVVSSGAVGAQINFWWHEGQHNRGQPLAAIRQAIRALDGASAEEISAWKTVFDVYVTDRGGIAEN